MTKFKKSKTVVDWAYLPNNKLFHAFTLAEFFSPHFASQRKTAFTLAEVLITLAIIGIVAALTIPTLVETHNAKAWATAKDLNQKKFVGPTMRMNVDGVMTGDSTT